MSISDYGSNLLLDSMLEVAALSATYYLALVNGEPEETDDGTDLDEPTDAAYARQAIGTGATYWNASESGVASFKTAVTFPTATEDWPVINYWVLCTAVTAGEIILWGDFDEGFQVLDTQVPVVPAEALTLTIAPEEENMVL